jgi:hypothetical protein
MSEAQSKEVSCAATQHHCVNAFVCSASKERWSVEIYNLLSVFFCLKNKRLALPVLNVIYYYIWVSSDTEMSCWLWRCQCHYLIMNLKC